AQWTQVARLTASDATSGDFLGASPSIVGDEVLVGSMWDDRAAGYNVGAVYVFDLIAIAAIGDGDLDDDGDVDLDDQELFVSVLLGADTDPQHVSRADMDCSGEADGRDIRLFIASILN